MHQIENEYLKIRAREVGAELTSVLNKKSNIEHLWQADPKFWPWHAPVLFPVVGRCLNDQIVVDGVNYPMEKHGFARNSAFKVLEITDSRMVFSLAANNETLKVYPFDFEFLIGYRLDGNKLHISYEVINKDSKTIYFSVGGHPALTAPFLPNENYDDYYLEFELQEEEIYRHYIDENGFFDGRKDISLFNSNTIQLKTNLFRDDALIFKDLQSRKVTLKSRTNPHYVTVDFKGFKYLGLWAKVGAPYVCIEPWLGCADTAGKRTEYKDKEAVMQLGVGQQFSVSYSLEIV